MSTDPASPVSTTTASTYVPRRIDEYLKEVLSRSGSDLHFIANDPPRIRLYGELQPLRQEILSTAIRGRDLARNHAASRAAAAGREERR